MATEQFNFQCSNALFNRLCKKGHIKEMGYMAAMVYLKIITHANHTYGNEAFPSYELMMDDLGMSRGAIRKSIKILQDKGYITYITVKRGKKNSKGEYTGKPVNVYTIVPLDVVERRRGLYVVPPRTTRQTASMKEIVDSYEYDQPLSPEDEIEFKAFMARNPDF